MSAKRTRRSIINLVGYTHFLKYLNKLNECLLDVLLNYIKEINYSDLEYPSNCPCKEQYTKDFLNYITNLIKDGINHT